MFQHIQLVEVVAQGFRGFKEAVRVQLAPDRTTIVGENGMGKTSLAEAIAWAMTGRSFKNKSKDLNLIHQDEEKAVVRVRFKAMHGTMHEIERRTTGSGSTLKVDGTNSSQKKLNELLSADLFLLVFNPLVFVEMEEAAARKALVNFLRAASPDDILARLTESEQALLQHIALTTPEKQLKAERQRRDELKQQIHDEVVLLETMASQPITIPEAPTPFSSERLDDIRRQLAALQAPVTVPHDVTSCMQMIHQVEQELWKAQNGRFPKEAEHQAVKMALQQKQQELQFLKETKPPVSQKEVLHQILEQLRAQYRQMKNQERQFATRLDELTHQTDTCPMCQSVLTPQTSQHLHHQVEQKRQAILAERTQFQRDLQQVMQDGQAKKAEVDRAIQTEQEELKRFEQDMKQKHQAVEQAINELSLQDQHLQQEGQAFFVEQAEQMKQLQERLQQFTQQKQQLDLQNQAFLTQHSQQKEQQQQALQQEEVVLVQAQQAFLQANATIEALKQQAQQQQQEMVRRQAQVDVLSKEVQDIELKCLAIKNFILKHIELLHEQLAPHLTDVHIELVDLNEDTGEVRDVFRLNYQGKPFKVCSTAEQVKAGLEVSAMISRIADVSYPTFIDNRESIVRYETRHEQVIEAVVQEGVTTLSKSEKGKLLPLYESVIATGVTV